VVKSTGGQASRGLQEYIKYSGPQSGSSKHNTITHLSHTTIQPQLNQYFHKPPFEYFLWFKPLFSSLIFYIFHCIPSTTIQPLFSSIFHYSISSMMSLYSTNHNSASCTQFLLIPLFHLLSPTTSQPFLTLLVDLNSHLLISSTTFWPFLYFPPKRYIKSLFPLSSFLSPSYCIHQYSSLVTTLNPSNILNSYYQPPWV
jgi:hypothetical protein